MRRSRKRRGRLSGRPFVYEGPLGGRFAWRPIDVRANGCKMRHVSRVGLQEMVMSVALFWGVGLAALGWLAFEIAEFM
jgi:hypothetical protein